ncbi:hypothetical protein MASR2M117_23650 [Paludibacter sp.]
MKQLKFIFATLVLLAMATVSCEKKDVTPPDEELDYPELAAVDGKIVIAAKFETAPCNDVVFIGTNVGWNAEDVAALPKFTPVGTIDGKAWDGWYKVVIDTVGASAEKDDIKYLLAGKPVQLDGDGKFSWDYQIGYSGSADVVKKAGDVDIYEGYANECDIFYASTEPIALVFAKWKKDPCAAIVKHNYTFTVTVPAGTPTDANIYIVGGFKGDYPSWSADATNMKLTRQTDGKYTITLNQVEEGTEYKYVLNGSWDNEELAAKEEGADCAKPISNRVTGTSDNVADVVANWKGVTAERCAD